MKKTIIAGTILGVTTALFYGNIFNKSPKQYTSVQANAQEYREELYTVPSISSTPSPRPTERITIREEEPPTLNQDSTRYSGKASYYTNEYCRKHNPSCITASGEVFDDTQLTTACSSDIPLGSTLLVKHGDASIQVRCNDRGSFKGKYNRILDLSKASFEALSPLSKGVIEVQVELIP